MFDRHTHHAPCCHGPRPQPAPRRRRGSILIMVVGLLTLVALIGTALIATARTDRYTTRAYVDSASIEGVRNQYLNRTVSLVEDALRNDKTPDLDSPYADTWLADRLPERLGVGANPNTPVWRHITGRLSAEIVANPTELDEEFPSTADFAPPFQAAFGPLNVRTPASSNAANNYIKMLPMDRLLNSTPNGPFFSAEPTAISITYPNDHPDDTIRSKTRTFPALRFRDTVGAVVGPAGGYLAADADGDGIADAALFRLSPTPVDGVTYYAGVRIVDNSSAVNVNTAWSRDQDFDAAGTAVNPSGFHTSNVGLYELLQVDNDLSGRPGRDNEIADLNEFRFGYPYDPNTGATSNNWSDSFGDYGGGTPVATLATDQPIEDPDSTPTFGNNGQPTPRNDFDFATRGEALTMQLGRRLQNPGYNRDPAYTPPTGAAGDPFRYRAYSMSDPSTGALAYRFGMANPAAPASDIELRLRHSIYESTPNYTDWSPRTPSRLPGWGFSGDTTRVPHWTSFPANEVDLWFQYLDFTPVGAAAYNPIFTPTRSANATTGGGSTLTGPQQFRSVRPLLTAYNAVSNLVPASSTRVNTAGGAPYAWSSANNETLLYPGMLRNDMSDEAVTDFDSSVQYRMHDMVRDPATRLTYMRKVDSTSNVAPGPLTDPNFTVWEPQNRVTGRAKANPNLAGFPELWRAFFQVMLQPEAAFEGGTHFDADWVKAVNDATGSAHTTLTTAFRPGVSDPNSARFYSPFLGMRWVDPVAANQTDPQYPAMPDPASADPNILEENQLRMFRSSIRDPRDPAGTEPAPGLHRLTPHQMMVLRSAIAANNLKQMLATNPLNVVARTFTLYDVNPAQPNPPSGTPAQNTPVPQYEVTVYGNAPQPFITEVYVSNDNYAYTYTDPVDTTTYAATNVAGYAAIELYNPYPFDLDLSNYVLATLDRGTATYGTGTFTNTGTHLTELATLPPGTTIKAGAFLVLDSYDPADAATAYRPPSTRLPFRGASTDAAGDPNVIYVPQLVDSTKGVIPPANASRELVILRPRITAAAEPLENMVPVDQFDFTGFPALAASGAKEIWRYARDSNFSRWVYPGRYDASPGVVRRHQGIQRSSYDPAATPRQFDPWTPEETTTDPKYELPEPFKSLIAGDPTAIPPVPAWNNRIPPAIPITLAFANPGSTYANLTTTPDQDTVLSIQLPCPNLTGGLTTNVPGPNPIASTGNLYPFGGFARNGDLLQVPYIGAYRIRRLQPAPPFANAIDPGGRPATDNASGATPNQVVPVIEINALPMDAAFAEDTIATNNNPVTNGLAAQAENIGRFTPNTVLGTGYVWTKRLFDYFSVHTPSLDFLPNVDPHRYTPGLASAGGNVQDLPQAVANRTGTVQNTSDGTPPTTEDYAGVHGLININTAPARVLAALPLVRTSTGAIDAAATETLARAIANHRRTGPYVLRSVFDLNLVPNFTDAFGASEPNLNQGDLSPPTGTDGVRHDYEEQYLVANRISNLVTTKSDTYTVYIVVQGWRQAGTPYPYLEWEKRLAYIMDRSTGTVQRVQIPTE